MAGMSSSYADRVSRQFEQQFGRPANADDPQYADYIKSALPQMINDDRAAYERSKARWRVADKFAMGAAMIPFTAGLSSILSPAAAGASASTGGATAPAATAGALSRIGSVLSSRGFETGANLALGAYGMYSQNKANAQARRDALAAQTKAIELEQAKLAEMARNADLDREDARKLNDAIQQLEAKKFALQQDQVAWERGIYEQEQARRAPYDALSQKAAAKMSSILGL